MDLTNYDEVRAVLQRHGFRFTKSMGQNFLRAAWVPERIALESGADGETGVLEVGPGVGCLTRELSARAKKVVSVELDRSLMPVLAETLAGCENTEVVFADILKTDLAALCGEYFSGCARTSVCANLPYNITSPALTKLISAGCFSSLTVMIQREVARRICARENTPDYGAFTVFVQWHCRAELLFDVSPDCFIPAPKVTSTVVRLTPLAAPPVPVRDEKFMFSVVRAAFNQRRKTLANALQNGLGESLTRERIAAALAACGLDARVRGEVLSLSQFARLSDALLAECE